MLFRKSSSGSLLKDEELIRLYQQTKDSNYVGELYRRYTHLVYGVCLKYLKDPEESKDAVMQIFEQLIQKLKVHEVANFKNWLYSLCRNYCLMELRQDAKHEFVHLEDGLPGSGLDVEQELSSGNEGELRAMESCIKKLPDEQRISIDLFYLQQKCYKEVADITGFDINKVKSYIQNGKRNLKICMERNRGNE